MNARLVQLVLHYRYNFVNKASMIHTYNAQLRLNIQLKNYYIWQTISDSFKHYLPFIYDDFNSACDSLITWRFDCHFFLFVFHWLHSFESGSSCSFFINSLTLVWFWFFCKNNLCIVLSVSFRVVHMIIYTL